MISRRLFVFFLPAMLLLPSKGQANPLFYWILRSLGRSGVKGASRRTLGQIGGSVSVPLSQTSSAARYALSVINVIPYAARNPESRAKAIEYLTLFSTSVGSGAAIAALMAPPAEAAVRNTNEDSPLLATAAYYYLLVQNDKEAALAMWIDPDVGRHFSHIHLVQRFYIEELSTFYNDGTYASVSVGVYGKNYGEAEKYYRLNIHWVLTDYGWLISGQES